MRNIIRSVLLGSIFGVVIFIVVGWTVYSVLWWYTGMGKVQAVDNPAVALGALWCFGWGMATGGLFGLTTLVLVARHIYRRTRLLTQRA